MKEIVELPTRKGYLEVRHGDSVDHVLLRLLNLVKEIVESQDHYPRLTLRTQHRICLSCPCVGGGGGG